MKKKKISKLVIFNGAILLVLYRFYKIKKSKKIENAKLIKRNYTKLGTIYLEESKVEQFLPIQKKKKYNEGRSYTKIKRND